MRSPKASIALASEEGFERALGHDHVEGDLEGGEHDERKEERGEQRFPDRDASDEHHEAGDQQEARHVEPEPLGEQAEQQGRDEYLQHAAKLLARDEGSARSPADEELLGESPEARGGEDRREIEREVARLR